MDSPKTQSMKTLQLWYKKSQKYANYWVGGVPQTTQESSLNQEREAREVFPDLCETQNFFHFQMIGQDACEGLQSSNCDVGNGWYVPSVF